MSVTNSDHKRLANVSLKVGSINSCLLAYAIALKPKTYVAKKFCLPDY